MPLVYPWWWLCVRSVLPGQVFLAALVATDIRERLRGVCPRLLCKDRRRLAQCSAPVRPYFPICTVPDIIPTQAHQAGSAPPSLRLEALHAQSALAMPRAVDVAPGLSSPMPPRWSKADSNHWSRPQRVPPSGLAASLTSEFAADSPLEQTRFELAVPPRSRARLAHRASRFPAGRARLSPPRQMWSSHQTRPWASGVRALGPHDSFPSPVHHDAAYRRVGALPLPTWPEIRIGVWRARFYQPSERP
jgi:hypothetical protein